MTGYDVDVARAARAREGGVHAGDLAGRRRASMPTRCSRACRIPPSLRRAYLGADGVLSTVKAGATLLDLSTVDPDTWREVAAAAAGQGRRTASTRR